jgi:trk system potassium uptake protein
VLHGEVHFVVVGCGRVGSGMAVRLTDLGHSVAILDKDPKAFRRLPPSWPGTKVVGSGFDRDALDEAGAGHAMALAAVTSGDNSNILTARIARETYEVSRVVARIYDPRRAEIYQRLGIPTVATVTWTIDRVLQRMLPEEVAAEWMDATGSVMLLERLLPDEWAGCNIGELVEKANGKLVAVTRAGEPRIDVGALLGQEGDVMHVAVMKDGMDELVLELGKYSRPTHDTHPAHPTHPTHPTHPIDDHPVTG